MDRNAALSDCKIHGRAFRELVSVLLVNSVQARATTIHIVTRNAEADEVPIFEGDFRSYAFCMECKDDGIGLLGSNPEEIFSPEFTTKEGKQGTGLGLYIARKIANRAGGDLVVKGGKDHGKGVTFLLVLPVSRDEGSE